MIRTLLIARREFMAYVRTFGFWLSLLALPFFALLGSQLPGFMQRAEPVRTIAIIETDRAEGLREAVVIAIAREGERRATAAAGTGGLIEARPLVNLVEAPPALADSEDMARDTRPWLDGDQRLPGGVELEAVVVLDRASDGQPTATVWSASASDRSVEQAMRTLLTDVHRRQTLQGAGVSEALIADVDGFRPQIEVFSPRSASGAEVSLRDRLPGILGFVIGMLLWSSVLTGSSMLLNSVMEEKANRVLEVLLSSASATEILAGKVLGVAALTLTVLGVWATLGITAASIGAPEVASEVLAVLGQQGLVVYLLIYLIGGYLMYAAMFTAIGAFCETPRDAQTLMGPMMLLLFVPVFVMQLAIRNPDAALIKTLSWVPFFTPFLMSARAPSQPPLPEVIGTIAVMLVSTALVLWLAGKAFRAGALSTFRLEWKSLLALVQGRR